MQPAAAPSVEQTPTDTATWGVEQIKLIAGRSTTRRLTGTSDFFIATCKLDYSMVDSYIAYTFLSVNNIRLVAFIVR